MTDTTARRIFLAILEVDVFSGVAVVTGCAARGELVQEDLGFTPDEVHRARRDRAGIARRYGELKRSKSFLASVIEAKLEFLEGVEGGEGRAGG